MTMTTSRTFEILRRSSAALMSLEALYLATGGWLQIELVRAMSAFDGQEVPMRAVLLAYGVLWLFVVTLTGASITLWKPSRSLNRVGRYWLMAAILLHGLLASLVIIGVPFTWPAAMKVILIGFTVLVAGTCTKTLFVQRSQTRPPQPNTTQTGSSRFRVE